MYRVAIYLLILLLSLPLVGQGQVLCIGADGHVAVESARNGKCCDGSSPDRISDTLVVSGRSTAGDDCGVCTDIYISSAAKSDRAARAVASPVSFVVPMFPVLYEAPGISTSPASHPPRQKGYANSPLSHLRTVMILV